MPPPLFASPTATRFAAQWIVDALAGDEALDFSILKALVPAVPECLTGAPDATRERVALRCLQEVASVASGGDATATAGGLRVEAARSCEDLLLELMGKVGRSGTLDKDMLPLFRQDIQNIICMKKSALPETWFELIKKAHPEIASMVPSSLLEQNDTNQHNDAQSLCSSHDHVNKDNAEFQQEASANLVDATLSGSTTEPLSKKETEVHAGMFQPQSPMRKYPNLPPHYIDKERLHDGTRDQSLNSSNEGLDAGVVEAPTLDRSTDTLPTNASEPGQLPESVAPKDMTTVLQPCSSKTDTNVLQHGSVDKENQVLDDVSASILSLEKNHVHEELTAQGASALPSVSCNDAIQGAQSETNHPPGNATEHTIVIGGQIGDRSHIEFSGADKVNEALHDDVSILEKTKVHGGLHVQATSLSRNCNLAIHDKTTEGHCSYEQNTGKSRIDAKKNSSSTSVPNIPQDGTGTSTTNISNRRNIGDTSEETPHVSSSYDSLHGIAATRTMKMPFGPKDQEMNDSLEGLSQQDLCIKCGKAGQLLKCSGCLLAAHDSCFGSSVAFQESDMFDCPLCFYTKATEAYQKAKKTFFEARKNLTTFLGTTQVVGPRAPGREVSDSSKRKNTHQHEGASLAHRDEEHDRQRKKQKINATGDGYPEEIVTEKASPFQNSNIAITKKHSVLKDNSINKVRDAERQQLGENKETGNGSLSHEARCSSENRCPPANQEAEADNEDASTKSHQSNDSDEIEATSSNDSSKRSSPPWRKMRRSRSRLLEKETVASSNSRKTIVQQDQHLSSPSRKRNHAPQKRYSNPTAPTGRRTKLKWTEEEETVLKDAMTKFARQGDGPIPWVQILEYGRDVFHRTRLPADLRVKWRNIMKKAGS